MSKQKKYNCYNCPEVCSMQVPEDATAEPRCCPFGGSPSSADWVLDGKAVLQGECWECGGDNALYSAHGTLLTYSCVDCDEKEHDKPTNP